MAPSKLVIATIVLTTSVADGFAARIAVLHGHQATFHESAHAVSRALERAGHECKIVALERDPRDEMVKSIGSLLSAFKPDLIACAGGSATEIALTASAATPVVAFMVPNLPDAPFVATGHPERKRVAAVAADADPRQLLGWMQKVDPSRKRIGVLHSERTRETVSAMRQAARPYGITITAISASADAFPDAINALDASDCDGVLMIPDATVYNAPNVKRLLLWGIRHRKAVWAFSESIVKAGALAGQYPDTESVARRATQVIQQILDGHEPGELPIQYAPVSCQAVNDRTAQLIDLRLHPDAIGRKTVRFGDDQ